MKKLVAFLTALTLLGGLTVCEREKAEVLSDPLPSASVSPTPSPTPEPTPPPTAEDIFPREFCFMNGVGGWHSELYIERDGSFAGHMEDWLGWGAEEGDMLWCSFSGRFSLPEKVNDYTYSIYLEELVKGSDGAEETEIDYVAVDDARGLESGEEFYIYLPGAPLDELPEEFVGWVRSPGGIEENDTVLPWYGLYNVNEQCGWFEW